MARGSRNTPKLVDSSNDKKGRKSPSEVKTLIVSRARAVIRRSIARLQMAEMRSTGNPEGNFDLLEAYRAFDAELVKIVTYANQDSEEK